MKQKPIKVQVVEEEKELTLGKAWGMALASLSFGLFFFWFPPLMILCLIISAFLWPISIIWSLARVISIITNKFKEKENNEK